MRVPTARSLRVLVTITGKDLRQQLRNGTLLVFALVLPLGLAFLFTSIFGGSQQLRASYAVVDADGGEVARVFSEEVLGAVGATEEFEIRPAADLAEGQRLAADGDVAATFVIPPGFSAAVTSGRPATLEVIGNVDSPISSVIAAEIAGRFATELEAVRLATAAAAEAGADPTSVAELMEADRDTPPALVVIDADTEVRRQLDAGTYYAAGMAVFFLLFTAGLSISGLLVEREGGTLARLLAAPAGNWTILASKLLSTLVVSLLAMTLLVATSTVLLGASWGPLLGVAVLVLALALAATGLTGLLATFARNAEQASNWTSVVSVLLGLFGGAFVPLSQLGGLTWVSYATPHRWFLQGLSELASGDLTAVVAPAAALLTFAAVSFGLALPRAGRVVRP